MERSGKVTDMYKTGFGKGADENGKQKSHFFHYLCPRVQSYPFTKNYHYDYTCSLCRPLYVMLKPAGALCNLACDYCYYLEKAKLYQDNPKHVMSDELLEKFIEEYINSQTSPNVLFTWHGGETLMRPLAFYQKALELQKKYAKGRQIDNCLQTNGTLLTDEWCRFLHDNGWLVGISIDGPQEFHDEYRKNKQGRPSFVKVMQGINLLNQRGASGSISGTDLMTAEEAASKEGTVTSGSYIRPFTVEFGLKYNF